MTVNAYIGWDVGGAHLKMAHIDPAGQVISASQFPSPLWKGLHVLDQALSDAKKHLPQSALQHSITTTAELVDIFKDRHSGIRALVDRLSLFLNRDSSRFYAGQAGWVSPAQTENHVKEIASANWHATARFVANKLHDGVLVDIGSTTTDIVPFNEGKLLYRGYSDYERMYHSELVYTGIIRTPVMAVINKILSEGKWHPVVAEHFATMADVYRLTHELQELDDMMDPADGAGKEPMDSARRLARMLGTDINEVDGLTQWQNIAFYIAEAQLQKIQDALYQVKSRDVVSQTTNLVGAGAGRFLVNKLAQRTGMKYMDFADILDAAAEVKPHAAKCATAVAVAQIARITG